MKARAVTMVEVAIGTVILSLALIALTESIAETTQQSARPMRATVASFLVTERMEQIVAARYRSTSGYAQVVPANFPDESPVAGFPAFSRTVSIAEVAADLSTPQPGSGLKRVTVNVSWDGGSQVASLSRVFADF
jgi:Tfp pilus assembly protein PilV